MEVLLILFLLFGGWRLVVWAIKVAGGAASDVASGRSSFKDGVAARTRGMSGIELKVNEDTVGKENIAIWRIHVRGLFPVGHRTRVGVVFSLLDVTEEGDAKPVLSALEDFQEPDNRAFQFVRELGPVEPGQGFLHWVDIGAIPKDLLLYPNGGRRTLGIVVRIVDLDKAPSIRLGFSDANHPGILHQFLHKTTVTAERGFLERSQEELGIAAASIRLGLALAYADGSFDPAEGKTIKEWAEKFVNDVPEGSGREEAREFINDAIRYGNSDAKRGDLSVSKQVDLLNKLAAKPEKYAAVELCLDVMAADGNADKSELEMLNKLCTTLGLSKDRFDELRDHRMINVDSPDIDGENIWESLGIDKALPDDEKEKELRKLFSRWNARAESLEDGNEREKAHQKLELIAEAKSLLNA